MRSTQRFLDGPLHAVCLGRTAELHLHGLLADWRDASTSDEVPVHSTGRPLQNMRLDIIM